MVGTPASGVSNALSSFSSDAVPLIVDVRSVVADEVPMAGQLGLMATVLETYG